MLFPAPPCCTAPLFTCAFVLTLVLRTFSHAGITSLSPRRILVALRCNIRMEVPLTARGRLMVQPPYLRHLAALANQKMADNRRRTEAFHRAFLQANTGGASRAVKDLAVGGGTVGGIAARAGGAERKTEAAGRGAVRAKVEDREIMSVVELAASATAAAGGASERSYQQGMGGGADRLPATSGCGGAASRRAGFAPQRLASGSSVHVGEGGVIERVSKNP